MINKIIGIWNFYLLYIIKVLKRVQGEKLITLVT